MHIVITISDTEAGEILVQSREYYPEDGSAAKRLGSELLGVISEAARTRTHPIQEIRPL